MSTAYDEVNIDHCEKYHVFKQGKTDESIEKYKTSLLWETSTSEQEECHC